MLIVVLSTPRKMQFGRRNILSAMNEAGEIIKSCVGEKIADLVSVFRLGFGALVISQMRILPSELLM